MTEDHPTRNFWRWFEQNRSLIEEGVQEGDSSIVAEIDQRVASLHADVTWEVGPGEEAPWMLAISPNGDQGLLPATEAIVSEAPAIPGWEVLSAKPRKQWLDDSRHFEFGNVAVDATPWTYVLTAFNNHEFYDITWIVPNVDSLGDIDRLELATFVLQSEVGELLAITRFDRIALVDVDTLDPQIPVSPIVTLHAHLQSFRH